MCLVISGEGFGGERICPSQNPNFIFITPSLVCVLKNKWIILLLTLQQIGETAIKSDEEWTAIFTT